MWRPERKSQANFFGGFNFFGGLIIKEPWAIPDTVTPKNCYPFQKNRKISTV